MRIRLQQHERWRRTLWITLPADVVEREREKVLGQVARRLKVPGYRKASAVEHHKPAVLQEMLQRLMQQAYGVALRERALQPINEGEIQTVDYPPQGDLTFSITFDVRPAVELTRLGGFRVEWSRPAVGPADVEQVLERVRTENAIWRPADDDGRPVDGDLVTIEIERIGDADPGEPEAAPTGASAPTGAEPAVSTDAEPAVRTGAKRASPGHPGALEVGLPWVRRLRLRPDTRLGRRFQFVLGEGDALPALEETIRRLAPGETGELDLPPELDAPAPAGSLRLRVTLQDRRMRDVPDLDDAFARSLGDFPDVESLRRRVLADLEEEAEELAQNQLAARLLDQVLEANPFDVPATMVERYLDRALGDVGRADPAEVAAARAELRPVAETAVKRMVAVEWIASAKSLAATPEEVDRRLSEIARMGQVEPEEIRRRLVESGRLEGVARDITERKVLTYLESQSEIVETEAENPHQI